MKCLIIAAGKGSRLREKGNSKPLIPLLGVPIIERVVRSAVQAGIGDFYVVTGFNGEKVREFLDNLSLRIKVNITHIINDEWEKGNGISVLKARNYLKNEKFLLLMSDHLFEPEVLRKLAESHSNESEVVLAVDYNTSNHFIEMQDVTKVMVDNNKITNIGKNIEPFNGFDTGIFLCSPSVFGALEESVSQGDTTLSGGIRILTADSKVSAFDFNGRFWIDLDDKRAMEKAERILIGPLKSKPTDGPISRYINRPLSVQISRYLVRTPATPNQISFFTFILTLVAAWFISKEGYWALATGAILAQIASIVDGCDGEVARLKFLESDYGGWFDAVLDRYADAFLLFGLMWHAYEASSNSFILLVGFLAIIGSFMLRDLRVFIIFLGALLNQPFLALLILAVLMNAETARRVIVCRNA
jgi:CDP-L-myo-inositol myo-inositolphosphotransferase